MRNDQTGGHVRRSAIEFQAQRQEIQDICDKLGIENTINAAQAVTEVNYLSHTLEEDMIFHGKT